MGELPGEQVRRVTPERMQQLLGAPTGPQFSTAARAQSSPSNQAQPLSTPPQAWTSQGTGWAGQGNPVVNTYGRTTPGFGGPPMGSNLTVPFETQPLTPQLLNTLVRTGPHYDLTFTTIGPDGRLRGTASQQSLERLRQSGFPVEFAAQSVGYGSPTQSVPAFSPPAAGSPAPAAAGAATPHSSPSSPASGPSAPSPGGGAAPSGSAPRPTMGHPDWTTPKKIDSQRVNELLGRG